MGIIDFTLHRCVPGLGIGRRWLKERLVELDVRVLLCEGCLQELVNDAETATWRRLTASAGSLRYIEVLREEIDHRAGFVHRWTGTDEPITPNTEALGILVRIARNYALPRPWKLRDPVVAEATRRTPVYWHWAGTAAQAGSTQ